MEERFCQQLQKVESQRYGKQNEKTKKIENMESLH